MGSWAKFFTFIHHVYFISQGRLVLEGEGDKVTIRVTCDINYKFV